MQNQYEMATENRKLWPAKSYEQLLEFFEVTYSQDIVDLVGGSLHEE